MMFLFKRITLLIFFLSICLLLFSEDTITFSGNNMKTILARGKERTLLSGMAELTSENNFISADTIELYGKDYNYIFCTGNVHVINKEKNIEVWSNKLYYDRKVNMIRFQENALMEDKENEIVVKGGLIETWEDDEITIIQIGVRILKKDMVCRSEFARYLRKEDRLELSGMPRVIWKGDEYKALKIFIDLENDEIHLEGNVKGEVFWEEEEKKEEGDVVTDDEGDTDDTDTEEADGTEDEDDEGGNDIPGILGGEKDE